MKKSFLYFVIIALFSGFTFFSLSEEKSDRKNSASACPYLNSLMNSSASLGCPFLIKKSEGFKACPYLNEKNASKCPYTEQMKENKINIERKGKTEIDIKS